MSGSKSRIILPGYMTVEATLVVTIALYVCFFIMYMGFYQYNRCIMHQNAYRIALRAGSLYQNDRKEVVLAADKVKTILLDGRYIGMTCKDQIQVDGHVTVHLQGAWGLEVEAKSACLNPAYFIRTCRQLLQISKEAFPEEDVIGEGVIREGTVRKILPERKGE